MTIKEIMNLKEGTPIRVKDYVDCADVYKKNSCRLSFYSKSKTGKIEYNPDTQGLDLTLPFGVELLEGGVCYSFKADQIELVPLNK